MKNNLTRRDMLKLGAMGLGVVALNPFKGKVPLAEFPDAPRLGRVAMGTWRPELKVKPSYDSEAVRPLYEDDVLVWEKEVIGSWPFRNNQKWVQTPEGYVWGAYLQPVMYQPNQLVEQLPVNGEDAGMWVEVSVPYIDLSLDNPPPRHAYFRDRYDRQQPLRFYYSQILWVDRIEQREGVWQYRVNERYGNRGDMYWADAQAFRPLAPEEIEPISPDVENKRIEVDVNERRQMLSCYEGKREVYFCQISSGAGNSTPMGKYNIWRKLMSVHMEGGTAQVGWDTAGVGWTNIFTSTGIAIHSTYWHNNFGEQESNGCINVSPKDAKWIFRWTNPSVAYEPGDRTITDFSATSIEVVAS